MAKILFPDLPNRVSSIRRRRGFEIEAREQGVAGTDENYYGDCLSMNSPNPLPSRPALGRACDLPFSACWLVVVLERKPAPGSRLDWGYLLGHYGQSRRQKNENHNRIP